MKKTRQLSIAARLILACMLLLSFSLPLTRQSAQASATSPTTQTTLIKPQTPQPAALIQAGNWSDNFDSYATDSSMHGQGGWKGWQNNPAGTAYTSDDHAISTPNSVSISAASDLVHEYAGFTEGEWIYTAWQFIPTDFAGESYFILLNQYDDAGSTLNWSVQVDFNGTLNQVVNTGTSGGTLPLIKDAWVELRVEIDLTHDTCAFFYDGQQLYAGTWTAEVSSSGISNIAAVDLFANNASPIFYDDISLTPPPIPYYLPIILR